MSEGIEKKIRPESNEYKNYVILGIGDGGGTTSSGLWPAYEVFNSIQEKIEKGAHYISIDKLQVDRFSQTPGIQEKIQKNFIDDSHERHEEQSGANFAVADANEMPLADESVNEIWMLNVTGDPDAHVWKAFSEIARVLKKGGVAYIAEYYTPDYSRFDNDSDIDKLKDLFRDKLGLDLVKREKEDFKDFMREQKADYLDFITEEPFVIELHKR